MHKKVAATYNPLCEMREYDIQRSPYHSQRVIGPREFLEEAGIEIIESVPAKESDILLAHTPEYLEKIKGGKFNVFDKILSYLGQIPASERIYEIAGASAGCATKALEIIEEGEAGMCFALTQPPGHHAKSSSSGGFCVFNNAAIIAKKAKEKYGTVAIIDIDVHHGNGTESIVSGDEDILFASVHVHPQYPLGSGWKDKENCRVYVALCPPFFIVAEEAYFQLFDSALEDIRKFEPELLIVSAGFDTYRNDLKKTDLHEDSYAQIGKKIAALKMPTVSVLEGGYVLNMLPKFITDYCNAWRVA